VSERAGQIVDAARVLIDEGGSTALTMRALGERLGIRAPSLYKHFPDKGAVEAQVITLAMRELASELARAGSLVALAAAYRAYALAHGMVVLELDGRFPPDAEDLDEAWRTGLAAFADR
jgi:hypothetical protein